LPDRHESHRPLDGVGKREQNNGFVCLGKCLDRCLYRQCSPCRVVEPADPRSLGNATSIHDLETKRPPLRRPPVVAKICLLLRDRLHNVGAHFCQLLADRLQFLERR
jgi:hypothetical protein